MEAWRKELYLAHFGIKGQHWGIRRGPPYPLDAKTKHDGVKRPSRKMSSADTRNGKVITKKALIAIGATAAVAVGVGVAIKFANNKSAPSTINAVKTVEEAIKKNADVPIESLDETFSETKKEVPKVADTVISNAKKEVEQHVATPPDSSAKAFPNAKELSKRIEAVHKKTLENDAQGKLFDKFYWESLTKDQQNAVKNYTTEDYDTSYRGMNEYFRYGKNANREETLKAVKNCSDALNRSILKDDAVSFRGVGVSSINEMLRTNIDTGSPLSEETVKSLIGRTFTEKGFYSSSIDPGSAFSGVRITTLAPKGTKAMYIAPVATDPNERELLIQRGSEFIIRDVGLNWKTGVLERLTVEVVSQP